MLINYTILSSRKFYTLLFFLVIANRSHNIATSLEADVKKSHLIKKEKGSEINEYFDNSFSFLWKVSLVSVYFFTIMYFLFQYFSRCDSNFNTLPDLKKTPLHIFFIVSHIIGGLTSMVLSLCQIITPLRKYQNYRWHSILGKVSLVSSVLTAICGILFIIINRFKTTGGLNMSIAFICAGLWFLTTSFFTFYYIKQKRNIAHHKEWAIRHFSMSISSMIYRIWFYFFLLVFNYQVPDNDAVNGIAPDYLRPLDSFLVWWFFIGGELICDFAIFSKRYFTKTDRQKQWRNHIMNLLSIVTCSVCISPWPTLLQNF